MALNRKRRDDASVSDAGPSPGVATARPSGSFRSAANEPTESVRGADVELDDPELEDSELDDSGSGGGGSSAGGRRRRYGGDDDDGDDASDRHPVAHGSAPRRRSGLIGFLQGSWRELQRVQWPDQRQVVQATGVVLGFVIVAGAYLGLADWVATKIVNFII